MILKKNKVFRKGYLSYSFAGAPEEHSSDIKNACILLNKGVYIVEVLTGSNIIESCFEGCCVVGKEKNFSYYVFNSPEFMDKIYVPDIKYMCIYIVDSVNLDEFNAYASKSDFACMICIQNYLDVVEMLISKSRYSRDTIELLIGDV